MKTPEQWAQEIELRCVADNRRPRMAVEADVIRGAVNEALEEAAKAVEDREEAWGAWKYSEKYCGDFENIPAPSEIVRSIKLPGDEA
jgi:hypothetical protein